MGFPKNSRASAALGREGTKATDNPVVYLPGKNVAGEGGVTAGRFVWAQAGGAGNDLYAPVKFKNVGTGAPAGIVESNVQAYIGIGEDATMTIDDAMPLPIVRKCDILVKTTTAASAGDAVFAILADGTISAAKKGATVSGAVETDFIVKTGGQAGSIILISNW